MPDDEANSFWMRWNNLSASLASSKDKILEE